MTDHGSTRPTLDEILGFADDLRALRNAQRREAETRRANGESLFSIATALGVSKDYLRERLGVR